MGAHTSSLFSLDFCLSFIKRSCRAHPISSQLRVWGGGTYKVNEKTSLNAQISYDEGKQLGVAANVSYDIVPGFNVTAEVDYVSQGLSNQAKYGSWTGLSGKDAIGGIVRFQRSF